MKIFANIPAAITLLKDVKYFNKNKKRIEEAKAKLEELEGNLAKNEKKKTKLMEELEESQDWDKIEEELEE